MSQQDEDSYLRRYSVSVPAKLPAPFDFLPDLLRTYAINLRKSTSELDQEWLESDLAELHHCHSIFTTPRETHRMNWTDFTAWAAPWVNTTMPKLKRPEIGAEDEDILQQEVIVQLLELYGTQHGYCKFYRYRPTFVHGGSAFAATATALQLPLGHARLAFVIAVRRRDPAHIKRLIRAIHMPHHYIVLHLDMQMDEQTQTELLEIAQDYDNMVVVRFGTIHEGMDGMTNVHLKLMRWLTIELNLKFDYHITLDGASFPLRSAEDMSQHLHTANSSVWLGTLTEQGKLVQQSQQSLLLDKRVATTSIPEMTTLSSSLFPEPNIPNNWFHSNDKNNGYFNYKTVSGSNAVFSQSIVRQLLASSYAMEIFGHSKYGCCGLDNYNWMAALKALDQNRSRPLSSSPFNIQQEAKAQTATFQLFGGADENCETQSGETAMLTMDASRCYQIEHPQVVESVYNESYRHASFDWSIPKDRRSVHGGPDLVKYLQHAKKAGFLFARQFHSADPQSVSLLDQIEHWWKGTSK